jgi:hypothetical protein
VLSLAITAFDLAVTTPIYDLSLIAGALADGNLVGAVLDPIVGNVGLVENAIEFEFFLLARPVHMSSLTPGATAHQRPPTTPSQIR